MSENGKRPLDVFTIVKGSNDKNHWIKIGAAWVNKDRSLNVRLDALPVNGELQIRKHEDRPRRGQGA